MRASIGIDGLAEFNRGLRGLDKEAPKQLRIALNGAAELLAGHVRPKVPAITGAARASIKARSTRTSARLSVGGRKAPYFPWLDFGGRTGVNRSVERAFYTDGRYVFVTLKEIRPQIEQALKDGLTQVARDAGLAVD